ncbi:MAG TPA: hypothetical protein VGD95_00065 [Micavibrio sp.]
MSFKLNDNSGEAFMRVLRNLVFLSAVSAAALSLSACETMKKTGDAITSIDVPFYGDDETDAQAAPMLAQGNDCPQVAVVEELKSLTQFEVPAAPTPGEKISTVAMTGLDTKCTVTENTVAVDIAVRFDGALGPQAVDWNAPSRSFAYPYFIAVTTPTGEILSKEVFAATIRYDQGETAITQQEKTRQVIPLREDSKPGQYEILIGFQLTEDELNYARMMASAPAAETSITPETSMAPVAAVDMAPTAKATPVYPEVKAAPAPAVVATPVAPAPLPTVSAPTPEPVPTTTEGSMKAAPTSKEVVEESPKPVAETVTPAAQPPAATAASTTEPATTEPAATEPASTGPTTAAPAVVDPYAPPPMQIIRIKPDGSVEKK